MCSTLLRIMPWLFHYLSVFVPLAMSMVSVVNSGTGGVNLPPIYWNSSNILFRSDSYTIHINANDNLEIYCPNYNGSGIHPDNYEYYAIYIVNKTAYDTCNRTDASPQDLIVNCSTPLDEMRFTLNINLFNPIPGTKDFHPGHTYYFITTSTGSLAGISNPINGACRHRHMKIKMEVCCSSTTRQNSFPPGSNSPTTSRPQTYTPRPPTGTTRTRTTTTTRRTTTTPSPPTTTTQRTTQAPIPPSTTTTNLPGGKPHDPTDIIIDAPGTINNVAVINSALTIQPSLFVLTLTVFLLTFALFSR